MKYDYTIQVNTSYLDFTPTAPYKVWTENGFKGEWCHLVIFMNSYAKRIVGFAFSDTPNTELTKSALIMAYHTRLMPRGEVHSYIQIKALIIPASYFLIS